MGSSANGTPPPLPSLAAYVTEHSCRQMQQACARGKVPWATFAMVVMLAVIFLSVIGVMTRDNGSAIAGLREAAAEAKVERRGICALVEKLDATLEKQARAFEDLRKELRNVP